MSREVQSSLKAKKAGDFLESEDQTYPIFSRYSSKRVALELLAPICKRGKSGIHSHGFFPPEASLPALDGGVDRLAPKLSFPGQI